MYFALLLSITSILGAIMSEQKWITNDRAVSVRYTTCRCKKMNTTRLMHMHASIIHNLKGDNERKACTGKVTFQINCIKN